MTNSRLKSFIDRVLRLKEEEDTIKADIREVYAEMKGEGYDKTAAGQLVAYLRKVEKKGREEIEAANTVFDLYLNEYENGTVSSHTHAREGNYQSPRQASMSEIKEAYKSGAPISQDFRFESANVYFIAFPGIGRIKIGISNEVERRIAAIEATIGEKADVLAVIPGNRQAEIKAHQHHAAWNVSGEWFRYCDELVSSIADYARTHTHENSYSSEKATVMDRATESSFETGSAAAETPRVGVSFKTSDGSGSHAEAGESPATNSLSSAASQAPAHTADDKGRSAEEFADRPTEQGGGDD